MQVGNTNGVAQQQRKGNRVMTITKEVKTTTGSEESNKENPKDNAVVKKAQFVCKDIVRKKKNPQQKLERYFAVTKAKVEKNFQGFPVTDCRYEEEIDKVVYCPPFSPWKKEEEEESSTKKNKEPELCRECLLRPCMVKARWNDIMDFCEDTMVFANDDSDAMYDKMINYAVSIQVEVFGARYTRQNPLPACVHDIVGNYFGTKSAMEDEEEEEALKRDNELVAASVDGSDFLTQSWQHS